MSQVTSEDKVVRQLQHKLLSVPKERLAELDRMMSNAPEHESPIQLLPVDDIDTRLQLISEIEHKWKAAFPSLRWDDHIPAFQRFSEGRSGAVGCVGATPGTGLRRGALCIGGLVSDHTTMLILSKSGRRTSGLRMRSMLRSKHLEASKEN
jgi:hypothetical protein